jgi:hypothetical protein
MRLVAGGHACPWGARHASRAASASPPGWPGEGLQAHHEAARHGGIWCQPVIPQLTGYEQSVVATRYAAKLKVGPADIAMLAHELVGAGTAGHVAHSPRADSPAVSAPRIARWSSCITSPGVRADLCQAVSSAAWTGQRPRLSPPAAREDCWLSPSDRGGLPSSTPPPIPRHYTTIASASRPPDERTEQEHGEGRCDARNPYSGGRRCGYTEHRPEAAPGVPPTGGREERLLALWAGGSPMPKRTRRDPSRGQDPGAAASHELSEPFQGLFLWGARSPSAPGSTPPGADLPWGRSPWAST